MKILKNIFFSILVVGLLFSCSSKENYDDLLRKIMVQHMNGMKTLKGLYKETVNENGDIFFGVETEAEHYSLKGSYQRKNDYLVFKLYFIYWDGIAEGSQTSIYKNDGKEWTSIFQEPIVDGVLDTIIDLNNDKADEIIMSVRTTGTRGKDPCDRLVLYGRKNSFFLEKIDVLAERINSDGKLIKDYSLSYEPESDGTVIVVKSVEGADLESDGPRKTSTLRLCWKPPLLVDLNKANDQPAPIASSESDYPQVKIGDQIWMTTNLEVTTFRNDDSIPQAKTAEEWRKAGEKHQPAWCYCDMNPFSGTKYGKLYNGYAVNDPRGLAPKGWHIPSDGEWRQLIDFLGEESAVAKLKSKEGWSDNKNGTNESGFAALPGGFYDGVQEISGIGDGGEWWSSTDTLSNRAFDRNIWDFPKVQRGYPGKNQGLSVRCIRD
jgi:uncharacterized protein (TIGR02145 family)